MVDGVDESRDAGRRDVMAYLRGWAPAAEPAGVQAEPVEVQAEPVEVQAEPATAEAPARDDVPAVLRKPGPAAPEVQRDDGQYRPRGPGRRTAKRLMHPAARALLEASERRSAAWEKVGVVLSGAIFVVAGVVWIVTGFFRH